MGRAPSNNTNVPMDPWNNYCLRALQCACELRATKDDNLGTHIAVTSGTLTLAILGGCNDEWSYIINGPCLSGINTPYQHTLSTHLINTPYQHTISTHPTNTPIITLNQYTYHHILSTHSLTHLSQILTTFPQTLSSTPFAARFSNNLSLLLPILSQSFRTFELH